MIIQFDFAHRSFTQIQQKQRIKSGENLENTFVVDFEKNYQSYFSFKSSNSFEKLTIYKYTF